MSKKRSHIDIDPDYEDVSDQQNKRQRVLEEGGNDNVPGSHGYCKFGNFRKVLIFMKLCSWEVL